MVGRVAKYAKRANGGIRKNSSCNRIRMNTDKIRKEDDRSRKSILRKRALERIMLNVRIAPITPIIKEQYLDVGINQ
jgi:hypothetical protein